MKRLAFVVLAVVALLSAAPSVAGAGEWPTGTPHFAVPVQRVGGADRFAAAANIARTAYPGWAGVKTVIVASGDNQALADPLAAGSLCWAYDAPILLVSGRSVPDATAVALKQIASVNPTATVLVVGGVGSVPSGRIATLRALVPLGTVTQPWRYGDRYSLARAIAARSRQVALATSRTVPPAVIVANGADSRAFFDALSAASVSAQTGIPVLLTRPGDLPNPTRAAVIESHATERIVVGGTGSVSSAVAVAMGATARWSGSTRWATSAAIARNAAARGWSGSNSAVLFNSVPDALAGAALAGRSSGFALVSGSPRLAAATSGFLASPPATPTIAYVLGGTGTIASAVASEVAGWPALPAITYPRPYEGARARVAGTVGSNTTTVTVLVNGVVKGSKAVAPFGSFDFGSIDVPSKGCTVKVIALNPDGRWVTSTRVVRRLVFPAANCILIVKHEFKLYWVRNNSVVKVYPIAIGRDGMETPAPSTWKILAKYKTDPSSVYGPRKMRLFRQRGSTYVYTAYGIHGTNQEWVIGTKASHGCIRMYNRDVLELWPQVPLGTLVFIRP